MAGLADVKTALAAEHGDLVTLTGLVVKLLQAQASGSLSAADAQALLDTITGDDASVKTSIDAITTALTPPAGGGGPA